MEVTDEFLNLWDLLYDFQLKPEVEDAYIWRLSSSGQYSAKSAYESFFIEATLFGPYERIWKSWAPPKCRFFMWLVTHRHMIGVGRLIGLQGRGCHIRHSAPSVIKRRKLLTICWFLVSSLGSFGYTCSNTLGSNNYVHSLQSCFLMCGGKIQAMLLFFSRTAQENCASFH